MKITGWLARILVRYCGPLVDEIIRLRTRSAYTVALKNGSKVHVVELKPRGER
jgi:hypothetical protein